MMHIFAQIPPEVFDAIGIAGFGLYVLNYTLLTFQKMRSEQLIYFAINWLAASMVLIGLYNAFNLAAALIQIFWIAISTVGILLRVRKQRKGALPFQTRRDY